MFYKGHFYTKGISKHRLHENVQRLKLNVFIGTRQTNVQVFSVFCLIQSGKQTGRKYFYREPMTLATNTQLRNKNSSLKDYPLLLCCRGGMECFCVCSIKRHTRTPFGQDNTTAKVNSFFFFSCFHLSNGFLVRNMLAQTKRYIF